jgi:hypothetical protein
MFSAGTIREPRRHPEADILGNAWQHKKLDIRQLSQPSDQVLYQYRWGGCAGGDAHRRNAVEPAWIKRTSILDQVTRDTAFAGDLAQAIGI